MAAKFHLLDSPTRFADGTTVTANCGVEIPKCVAVYTMDYAYEGRAAVCDIPLTNICQKCRKFEYNIDALAYTFVIASGEAAVQRGAK